MFDGFTKECSGFFTGVWIFIDSTVYLLIKLYRLFHWQCMLHTFRIFWKIEKRRRYFWSVLCMIITLQLHFLFHCTFLLLRLIFFICIHFFRNIWLTKKSKCACLRSTFCNYEYPPSPSQFRFKLFLVALALQNLNC